MKDAFRTRIRASIADPNLQAALDANAERRIKGRLSAFASLPDWQERRQRAHAVRAEVIAHLDEYLGKFIEKAEANGLTVHRAQDALEARQIVLGIISSQPGRAQRTPGKEQKEAFVPLRNPSDSKKLIAKSKSMVSEEIELNHALEAAGHRVVETDLGEYIVQLRGERPSHIITPAVHLRRAEVGQLFHEKLGIPYTVDIPTLTDTARQLLREVFLTADVGVSGVNFGVAETGTLCIVTNEGNGRMVTTLPPVHIALMGMERLVPSMDDLALMLTLLPRSATGQKLSVYTQLLQRPEPGQARHLVLVDNGRADLRESPLREALYCIRCGACLNACPVFRELGGHAYVGADGASAPYPGPIGSVVSPGLLGGNFVQLAQASSLCGACKEACPVDIDLPRLLTRVRAGQLPQRDEEPSDGKALPPLVRLGLKAYTRVAARPGLFGLAQRLLGILTLPWARSGWIGLPAASGWGLRTVRAANIGGTPMRGGKDLPRPVARPFRGRWAKLDHRGVKSVKIERMPKEAAHPAAASTRSANLVGRFVEELLLLGGSVTVCKSDELTPKLLAFLQERGIQRVQAWDQVPGLELTGLTEAGIAVEGSAAPEIEAGLTGALAGIAETGTLLIPGGVGRPLSASLLPGLHLAVLRKSALLPDLETALRLPDVVAAPATVLVSGPSRTADIEMTLTIGVHGPGALQVFLIDDSGGL
jgi:L-lactate dehydrogenase complex protein LldF